jgi:hypothetical protein
MIIFELEHDYGNCPYCGKHLLWGGMGWVKHSDTYHAYWYRYWLRRFAEDMKIIEFNTRL